MKRRFSTASTLVAIAFILCAATALPAKATPCNLATVGGSYGYVFTGYLGSLPGPFIPAGTSGIATFDGHGNVQGGAQVTSLGGNPVHETWSGSYTVNADCTGEVVADVVSPLGNRTDHVQITWTDDTNNAFFIFNKAGFTVTGTARKIHPKD